MSHPWTGHQQIGKVKPKAATAATSESWWMSGDFYAQARERFPEAGAAVSDRSRVYTRGAEFVRPSKGRAAL